MGKRKPGLHKKVSSIFDGLDLSKPKAEPPGGDGGSGKAGSSETGDQQKHIGSDKFGGRIVEKKTDAGMPNYGEREKYKLSTSTFSVSDRKSKMKLAMIPVLLIVFVFTLMWSLNSGSGGKKRTKALKPESAHNPTQIDEITPFIKIDWDGPRVYSPEVPDPMISGRREYGEGYSMPPIATLQDLMGDSNSIEESEFYKGLIIKSILYSNFSRSVVISNEILYEGDLIFGVTIKKINKDSIDFEIEGLEFSKSLRR